MQLFDTARQTVVPFDVGGSSVSMYVCGITPYDAAHLGHAFTYHVFDVMTRRLTELGVRVRSVRNVTDVDDDILRVARLRHVDYRELGDEQVRRFDSDMHALGLRPVDAAPRATQHVPEMVDWITRLVDGGTAYERDGWVYFRCAADPGFGRISHLQRDDMIGLSRDRGADPDDPRKDDPLDFVLWQRSLDDEPRWDSPWGPGRPGWHIECSVLSSLELGTPIDLHGGGDDLIFPHHECEAAQAAGAGVDPYVRHWVHVAMVRYAGEKMSKSLGNLVFVRDLLQRVPAATVRLLLAANHHRASWEYDESMLRDADERRQRYEAAMRDGTLEPDAADECGRRFRALIDDDLNTPAALRLLDDAAAAAARSRRAGVAASSVLRPLLDLVGA